MRNQIVLFATLLVCAFMITLMFVNPSVSASIDATRAQVWGYEASAAGYSGQDAYLTTPNPNISTGTWTGGPNGVTNKTDTFMESGPTKACDIDCGLRTKKELPELGLSEIGISGKEPPLALVVLEGKFEVQVRGMTEPVQVKYLFYTINLYVGAPTAIEYSRDGTDYESFLQYAKTFSPLSGDQPIDPNAKYFEPEPIQVVPPMPPPAWSPPEKPK